MDAIGQDTKWRSTGDTPRWAHHQRALGPTEKTELKAA